MKKTTYQINIRHNEDTLKALSRMQYDLFCVTSRTVRTLIGIVCVFIGALRFRDWWGLLLIAYGSFQLTAVYAAADHTAKKLAEGIKASGLPFPASAYVFTEKEMRILPLADASLASGDKEEIQTLSYAEIEALGEDGENLYVFCDRYGGYMLPKSGISDPVAFRAFLEEKTGLRFRKRLSPLRALLQRLRKR